MPEATAPHLASSLSAPTNVVPKAPSPQPTHIGYTGTGNGSPPPHRILKDEASGYIAPVFEGKEQQMELGTFFMAWLQVSTNVPQ